MGIKHAPPSQAPDRPLTLDFLSPLSYELSAIGLQDAEKSSVLILTVLRSEPDVYKISQENRCLPTTTSPYLRSHAAKLVFNPTHVSKKDMEPESQGPHSVRLTRLVEKFKSEKSLRAQAHLNSGIVMATNGSTISLQQEQLQVLYNRHISAGDPYCLVDFPNHPNVGDSAIWLGEIAILKSITGRLPSYVCTVNDFNADELNESCPNGVIFIHGGGNLGDIWPDHQKFREMIISKFPNREIVQLPQSIKFRDEGKIKQFSRIIQSHPKFTLYVRDEPSLQLAKAEFDCPTYLTPDSAFGMGHQQRHQPRCSVFMLLRTDSEKVGYDRTPLDTIKDAEIDDWLQDNHSLAWMVRFHRRITNVFSALNKGPNKAKWFNWLAINRVKRGMMQLSRGRAVITDRLHGHILCVLLDIPHVALDNDYGKVSNYINAWTNRYPNTITAKSSEEAAIKYRDILV